VKKILEIFIGLVLMAVLTYIALKLRLPNLTSLGLNSDEGSYLCRGYQLVKHNKVIFPDGMGGAHQLYPVISYLGYSWDGIFGLRLLNVIFGVLTVLGVAKLTELLIKQSYPESRILIRDLGGLISGLIVCYEVSAIYISRFATYDAMAICLVVFGLYFIVSNRDDWHWWTFALGPMLLSLSVATKYITIIVIPMVVVYLLVGLIKLPASKKWQPLVLGLSLMILGYATISLLGGIPLVLRRIESCHIYSLKIIPENPRNILLMSVKHLEQLIIYAISSFIFLILLRIALAKSKSKPDITTVLIFLFGSTLPIVCHMYCGHILSLHKHIIISVLFLAPIVGLAVAFGFGKFLEGIRRLKRLPLKLSLVGTGIFILLFVSYNINFDQYRLTAGGNKERTEHSPFRARLNGQWLDCRRVLKQLEGTLTSLHSQGNHPKEIMILNFAYNPLALSVFLEEKGYQVDYMGSWTKDKKAYLLSRPSLPNIIVCQSPFDPITTDQEQLKFLNKLGFKFYVVAHDPNFHCASDAYIFVKKS
jgi:4-amino-4-deoxy-L-arabinose transferase-like glycosyltransferase